LRNGELVGEWRAADLPAQSLVAAMVGRELAARQASAPPPADTAQGEAEYEFRGLGRKGQLHPTDLSLRAGEVLGLAGLLGSGRTEFARLAFGLDAADSGERRVQGRDARVTCPADAVALGMALCPEDRKTDGIVADLSVRENIVLALQARRGVWNNVPAAEQARMADNFVRALGIKAASIDTPIAQLSGGNQQKALLA